MEASKGQTFPHPPLGGGLREGSVPKSICCERNRARVWEASSSMGNGLESKEIDRGRHQMSSAPLSARTRHNIH